VIVVDRLEQLPLPGGRRPVATIGFYDGLHRGHQAILDEVVRRARSAGEPAAVVTFEPHPLRVLAPERAPRLLLTDDQKIALLERAGLDAAVFVPFDRPMAAMPAEVFAREVVGGLLRPSQVLVGSNFRFGRGRAGDVPLLSRVGAECGFTAEALPQVLDGGEPISASRIRRELADGRVSEAARLLGRPFALAGTIVHGEGRGGKVVVATANLAPENEFLPARGVYVTRLAWAGGRREGLTNVGTRPTFGADRITVETHLPGFEGDLYGARAELEFLARLREERLFATPADLVAQIRRDLEAFEAWRAAGGGRQAG
jgi:riboflavin kinase/FMN adenylyltransferase